MSQERRDYAAEIAVLATKVQMQLIDDESGISDDFAGLIGELITATAEYIIAFQSAYVQQTQQIAALTAERDELREALNVGVLALHGIMSSAERDGIQWYNTFPFGQLDKIAKLLGVNIWAMVEDAEDANS